MGHVIGEGVRIHPSARIDVEHLEIGGHSTVGPNCVIEGRDVRIGQELWMDEGAMIGGGSCRDPLSSLTAGHYLHLGRGAFINTARSVSLGNEVGLGMGSKVFTHGAYLSALDGFPVTFGSVEIGDNVWIPGGIVNPGVRIGSNVVIGVGSVVTHRIPSGSLAMGTPAKVVREDEYPRPLDGIERDEFWRWFLRDYPDPDAEIWVSSECIRIDETRFQLADKHINGPATDDSERLRNQLRRYGIRFYSRPVDGQYQDWA